MSPGCRRDIASKRRTNFPSTWHHVMNRVARREAIFRDEGDCVLFISCLAEMGELLLVEIHAYAQSLPFAGSLCKEVAQPFCVRLSVKCQPGQHNLCT